ncbi:alpha/beta hydrolase [Aurantiacibacter poecillastricola]|uniref:alpha/beta hydrolase n=1 Tax=Aurantiacibacter poecillastricola TaxID=3064385 RepID=UPI00273D7DF7|nr:alpha/beta hydrolase [Aurantiacibacter sp. 219JJ12-13]MDP5263032.1 alpha/beta hydrolase [Aurantiacibacter sp. 219JJ12-13]
MQLSRREAARLGLGALSAALIARSVPSLAQDGWRASTWSVADRLAPIAPELRPAARRMIESGFPPITEEMLRDMPGNVAPPTPELLPDIPVEERDIPPTAGLPGVKVFVLNSEPTLSRPAILHIHGGGHLVGSARGELRYLQETARELACTIVSVEYRLSPGARYSESTEDTYAGLKWLYDNADMLGVDRTRIALMGESAGGGHAAILAIKARNRGEVPVLFQSLVYPMIDDRTGSSVPVPPHIATVGWSPPENVLGWRSFLGTEPGTQAVPVEAVPSRTVDLAGLPPTWIGVGAVDLFAAEDIAYARRLILAGIPTELVVTPGAFHGFDRVAPETALARSFTASKMTALRRAFARA